MSVEYIPYRKKRLLQEMKTCKAYVRKVASGLREVASKHDAWMLSKAAELEEQAGELQKCIELLETEREVADAK